MEVRKKIAKHIARVPFICRAICEEADLGAFKRRPEKQLFIKNLIGLFLIIFSYVIGWPAVILLGIISLSLKEPLFVIIGGPVSYGLSHLVFLAGMYLTGIHYTKIFLLWAVRMAVEKYIGRDEIMAAIGKNKK